MTHFTSDIIKDLFYNAVFQDYLSVGCLTLKAINSVFPLAINYFVRSIKPCPCRVWSRAYKRVYSLRSCNLKSQSEPIFYILISSTKYKRLKRLIKALKIGDTEEPWRNPLRCQNHCFTYPIIHIDFKIEANNKFRFAFSKFIVCILNICRYINKKYE